MRDSLQQYSQPSDSEGKMRIKALASADEEYQFMEPHDHRHPIGGAKTNKTAIPAEVIMSNRGVKSKVDDSSE